MKEDLKKKNKLTIKIQKQRNAGNEDQKKCASLCVR